MTWLAWTDKAGRTEGLVLASLLGVHGAMDIMALCSPVLSVRQNQVAGLVPGCILYTYVTHGVLYVMCSKLDCCAPLAARFGWKS